MDKSKAGARVQGAMYGVTAEVLTGCGRGLQEAPGFSPGARPRA